MSFDYARMKEVTRILLGETDSSNTYFTDAEIAAMINNALTQVATDTNIEGLLTYRTYACIASQEEYALENDYLKIKGIVLEESTGKWNPLKYMDFKTYWQISGGNTLSTGTPCYYRLETGATDIDNTDNPGDFYLYPLPDSTYAFRVYFYQYPTDLVNDSDITELPRIARMAVCYYAAAILMRKSSQESDFRDMMGLYNLEIAKLNKHYASPQRDEPAFIRDVMGYGD